MLKIRASYYIIAILLLPFTVLCNKPDTSGLNTATILIFDNIPPYVRSAFPLPLLEHKDKRAQVTIFDNFYTYLFSPKPSTSDTVVVHQKNEHIVLTFLYSMTHEPLHYVIEKGDTITALTKDSLLMVDSKNNNLSLQTLLNLNKGKVIYVDFWASWCIPCRKEMKNAQKLQEEFKGKDVAFVYFSVDKSKKAWMEACNEERLNEVQRSYILTNTASSSFLRAIDLGPIPRYLLYDKHGKLIHKNAPSPGSAEIHRVLTEYLAK